MDKTEYLISPHNQTIADNHLVGQPLSAWTPTLAHALETFERLELLVKERSPLTIRWYHERLESMCVFLGADRSPNEILDVDLLDWMATLRERGTLYGGSSSRPQTDGRLSPFTLRGYVRAARRFWRWLHKRGFIESNPAQELPMPSKCKIAKRGIADCDQRAMIEAARPSAPPSKERMSRRKQLTLVRDYAILMFLSATGCRRGGVANLLLSDLNLDAADQRIRRRAMVREKGDKERTVVMTSTALTALIAWLEIRPAISDEHVFLGQSNGGEWKPFQEVGISEMVERYKLRLGLKGKCSPHEWRHRWARKRLLDGMELSQVSQLLGHEDVSVTVRFYGQFTLDQLQTAYDKFTGDG